MEIKQHTFEQQFNQRESQVEIDNIEKTNRRKTQHIKADGKQQP